MTKKRSRYVKRTLIKNNNHIKIIGNVDEVDEAVASLLKCDKVNPWRLNL